MTLRPYHEHPLLPNYSERRHDRLYRAPWYCGYCKREIVGPPWVIGECVVASGWRVIALSAIVRGKWYDRGGRIWRVYMRSQFNNPQRVPLFKSTRKAAAIKYARRPERNQASMFLQSSDIIDPPRRRAQAPAATRS
jgi:hypothetical protein